MARRAPEFSLHVAVAKYLDAALPLDALFFHVPNGGKRNIVEAAKLKAMGTKAGVADFIVIHQHRAMAIELKAPKSGRLSIAQEDWRAAFVRAGGSYLVARSIEDVHAALVFWGVPLRARVMAGGGWERAA